MKPSNVFKTDVRVCTESNCTDGDEESRIKCTKCKRSVIHFSIEALSKVHFSLLTIKPLLKDADLSMRVAKKAVT